MADDIDIEEHDILDNPRIQDILRIKEEPVELSDDLYEEPQDEYDQYNYYTEENYEDEGHTNDQMPQYDRDPPHDQEETRAPEPPDLYNDQDMEFNDTDENLNESVLESDTETDYMPDLSNEIYHHNNKIILGTKPCKRPERDVNGAYVAVEDWGVRLEHSNCYCKECQTLFATRNALDAHNMVAHSFLVALDSPESSESETPAVPEKTETAKYCDHCKKYFPSDHALIQHLYDLITANKQTPTVPTVTYNNCTNTAKRMVYSCLICNSAYLDIKWFKVHIRNVHKKTETGNFEHIPFTGVCKICNHTSTYLKRFNIHVKTVHIDKNDMIIPENAGNLESLSVNLESQSENVETEADKGEWQTENEESQSENENGSHPEKSKSKTVSGRNVKRKMTSTSKFKCIKCKSFYNGIKSVRHHQRHYHRGENVIQKVGPENVVSNTVQKIPQKVLDVVPQKMLEIKSQEKSDKFQFTDNLIPKNCIFKCTKCGIHFVTCWSAILHTCVEMISRYQCDICYLQFRLKDTKTHVQQHKYNDAFSTYCISKNMSTKMLFWCEKCAVYFELRKIQSHITICNGTTSSVRCKKCEIDVSDILSHMNHHKLHTDKSDFIFIDDLLPSGSDEERTPDRNLKRKLPIDSEPGPSKLKKLEPNEFMYCELCHTCMKTTNARACHISGECKKIKSKRNCEFCGLVFFSGAPSNYHEEYHRRTNARFKDFTFVNITDNASIVPHIPEFPKCDQCDTQDFLNHDCGSSKSCKVCKKKFSESAYKLHVLHHKYLKEDTEVNELIKKYETLTSTWNILYQCKSCNVVTDSYDDVVVHCQNHYNNIQNYSTRTCETCSLKLEGSCYKRHKELHSPSITRSSFKTVVYDYKNLLNEDWLKLFGALSEAEVHQIVTRSIYVTRFVKMKLILDGPPELTIYKCETCKLYVDPHAIYNHTTLCKSAQEINRKSYACETCLIPFSTATARKDHEKLHATPNITANSFRIVAFNDKCDREFNNNLQADAEALEFKPKTPININPVKIKTKVPKNTKCLIFYQCRQCQTCSPNAGSLIRHKCLTQEELVKCNKCHLIVPSTNDKEHRKWHKQNKNITKEHVKVLMIDNKILSKKKQLKAYNDIKKVNYKLHQCKKCKICYSFWVKHTTCSSKCRRCKKCGYLFSYSSYVIHSMWHEQNKDATRNDIKVVPLLPEQSPKSKAERRRFLKIMHGPKDTNSESSVSMARVEQNSTLYQCHKCKLCSYIIAFVKKHTVCSSNNKGTYHCKICDLKFKNFGMKCHNVWHLENKNSTRQNIRILPFKGTKILKVKEETVQVSEKKDAPKNIVSTSDGYNCKKCGASSKKTIFLNKHKCKSLPEKPKICPYLYYQCKNCDACSTSTRHYCVPRHRIRVCPRCKLKFTSSSIHDHMQKHAIHKNMTRSKIKVVLFSKNLNENKPEEETPASKPVQKVSTVFRCSCGLHFISQKTIERHFTICSPDHEIPSENCSKCGLLFPTNHLVSHLCNHHSYGKGNIEVKTIPTVTYYRCGSCKSLFISESRLLKHNRRCDPDYCKPVRCDECDLDFHESEIKMHHETHKTLSDLNKPCRIVTVNKNTQNRNTNEKGNETDDNVRDATNAPTQNVNIPKDANASYSQFGVVYDNRLYKCIYCSTHYLKLDSFWRHLYRGKCTAHDKLSCGHCGLNFTQFSLTRHTYIQHENLKLKLEDFEIILCDPKSSKTFRRTALKECKTETPDDQNDYNSDDTKIDLFKCHICNIHFLKAISLRNHILSGTHKPIKINCRLCGLAFQQKALELHLNMHHKILHLRRKNFCIVEKPQFESMAKKVVKKGMVSNVPEISPLKRKDESDVFNATQDDIYEPSETTIKNEAEDIIYYCCVKCNLNFTNSRSIEMHFDGKHIRNSIETCDICGLSFSSLLRHKQHHEGRSSGVFLIQDVNDESESINKLFKCLECGVHFMKPLTLINHINCKRDQPHGTKFNCPDCGLFFTHRTLKLHQANHHGLHSLRLENLVIDTSIGNYRSYRYGSDDNNMVSQSSSKDVTIEASNSKEEADEPIPETIVPEEKTENKSPISSTKLYKCGKCNVYFLTQVTCYKHIVKHVPMDPKEYIECKLCSFQFRIVSLNTHIRKHHKTDFAFDKVLIEEYQPKSEDEKTPKIDIYYAKDKVQSRLISTTTDDSVDNSAEISQSEIELTDDPEASNDSKNTVIIANTDNLGSEMELVSPRKNDMVKISMTDKAVVDDTKETVITNTENLDNEMEVDSKNVMVKIPSFTDIKEETDSAEEIVPSGSKTNEDVPKNEVPSNVELAEAGYVCSFCSESFASRRAKDFHESLDHLDALKDCPICRKSFNTSVLNELHLQIKNDSFTCCVCSQSANVEILPHHSYIHKHIL